MTKAHEIAASLTKGARRACLAMTEEYQFPGRDTFDANGAQTLHYLHGKTLTIRTLLPYKKYKRAAYRLTDLGLAVRAILKEQDNGQ